MPPKQRITKTMIQEGAFRVFRQEGMDRVNARSVARELGCSTQPIFSYFSGMNELKSDIEERAYTQFTEAIRPALAQENVLLACCCGYIDFAREEPKLFRYLFIESGRGSKGFAGDDALPAELFEKTASLYNLSQDKARTLCLTAAAYVHGLATVMVTDAIRLDVEDAKEKTEALILREVQALR